MPQFIQIGGLKDRCYVQIPDTIWSGLDELQRKQITEAVEKGFIPDTPGGIGIKKNPRYHISIKSDYRLCARIDPSFTSETVRSDVLQPFVSPYAGRTPATRSEQQAWYHTEQQALKSFQSSVTDVTLKYMVFDREKDHSNLSTP